MVQLLLCYASWSCHMACIVQVVFLKIIKKKKKEKRVGEAVVAAFLEVGAVGILLSCEIVVCSCST